jgi:hypothetical protein
MLEYLQSGCGIPPATTPGVTPPLLFQTLASPGIPTSFASGDFILFTGLRPGPPPAVGNPGPLTITFDPPVAAAGTQRTSSLALDNSAQFLGVRSDAANISRLVYSSPEGSRALGINALSIAETVPEPSNIAALAVAGL